VYNKYRANALSCGGKAPIALPLTAGGTHLPQSLGLQKLVMGRSGGKRRPRLPEKIYA
jgi:hypothetical protein